MQPIPLDIQHYQNPFFDLIPQGCGTIVNSIEWIKIGSNHMLNHIFRNKYEGVVQTITFNSSNNSFTSIGPTKLFQLEKIKCHDQSTWLGIFKNQPTFTTTYLFTQHMMTTSYFPRKK